MKRRQWNSTLPAPTTRLARGGTLARTAMRKHARPAAETERAHGPAEFREWMKTRPCAVCGRTPSDAAHVRSGGTGRKDDVARTVPLCADYPDQGAVAFGHHAQYDGRAPGWGKRTFVRVYGVDMLALAAATQAAWEARCAA